MWRFKTEEEYIKMYNDSIEQTGIPAHNDYNRYGLARVDDGRLRDVYGIPLQSMRAVFGKPLSTLHVTAGTMPTTDDWGNRNRSSRERPY